MGSARRAFEWFQNAPAGGGRKPVVRPYDYGFVGEMSVLLNAVPRRVSACRGRGRRTDRGDQGAAMARAGAPWAARAGALRDRREAERHGAARDGRGLGGVALVGFRRDGMPGGRAYSRDFQLPDETRRRI